jgi:hypothetical protein
VLNDGETNSPSVAHVGYDISPLSRVNFKILATRLTVRDSESCWFTEEIGTCMRCWESPGDHRGRSSGLSQERM